MKRLLPRTLAGRIALLLAGALLVANLLAALILAGQQRDFDRRMDGDREIGRIVALVPALEAVDAEARRNIAADASTRFLQASVDPAPTVPATSRDRRAMFVADRLSASLGGRSVSVAFGPRPMGHRDDSRHAPAALAVSIALRGDGADWLNVATGRLPDDRRVSGPLIFGLALGLSLVFVLGVSLLVARHLTRPLADLARAAEAAGRGDRTARMPEEGVREVQKAARAFNDMQARIARFDAERMRTLGAVGHDLRTPMTSLRLRAEMVDDADLRDPMIRTLDEMGVMADGLVNFARSGQEDEAQRRVDVTTLLQELCAERGAVWSGGPAACVTGRPVALRRVFGNLIDNALRYAGDATVSVAREGAQVVVRVVDTGPGIPDDRLAAMFAPFARGDHSRNTQTGGAGLGLSIAQTLVNAHAGQVTLRNGETGGLVAEVRLPAGDISESRGSSG